MGVTVVTNNGLVFDAVSRVCQVEFCEGGAKEALEVARDLVHRGAVLLTHPQYGNIQLCRNPVRSIALNRNEGALDQASLQRIEAALELLAGPSQPEAECDLGHYEEYCMLDYELFSSALVAMGIQMKKTVV